jgi:hypothetical protein
MLDCAIHSDPSVPFSVGRSADYVTSEEAALTETRSSLGPSVLWLGACWSIFALGACDPIITIAGANFPSWLLCMMVGAIIAAAVRPLLVLARLESQVGPLTLFYPSLIAMFAMIVWVIFFNRV